MNMQTNDQNTGGVAPESQRDSQQRLAMPREQEPPVDRTKDAVRSGVGGARLEWEYQVGVTKRWRGFLKGRPEITLFVLNLCADRDDRCHMLGAVMPDDAEREHTRVLVHWAKMAAEWYLSDFIELLGGGGAEQEADNGTREPKSGAQGHSDPS